MCRTERCDVEYEKFDFGTNNLMSDTKTRV